MPEDVIIRCRETATLPAADHARHLGMLSPDERERAGRFVNEADRVAFAAAHALVRETLSGVAGIDPADWVFTSGARGKPAIAAPQAARDLRFNLTHTRGLVGCAVCRGIDVGIDVESIDHRAQPLELATRYFSPQETRDLRAQREDDRPVRFIELWTLKEAFIKATGDGLAHPLDTFGFTLPGASEIRFAPPPGGEHEAWMFALYAADRFRLAVAVRASDERAALPVQCGPCILARLSCRHGRGRLEDC